MPQIGAERISFRGDGPWRGMTTKSKSAPNHFELLEDCYVSTDGLEIRTMPGFVTVIDPATVVRTPSGAATQNIGYTADTIDARRPVASKLSVDYSVHSNPTESMRVWAEPLNLFCFEQMHGRWVIVGESQHRREPIYNAGRTAYVHITTVTFISAVVCRLTVNENYDSTADTFNTILQTAAVQNQVFISGLSNTGAGPILNNKRWVVVALPAANQIDITADIGSVANNLAGQVAFVDRVTPTSSADASVASDDQVSLTTWTSLAAGDVDANPSETVYQAFVANRQRDFGDPTGNLKEGNSFGTFGRSRRRQRTLPYRPSPALAGDRLLLAAPGYNCVFQVPAVIPINYDEVTTALGFNAIANDLWDKPRMLGVPQATAWEDPDKAVATSWHIYDASGFASPLPFSFGGTGAGSARSGAYKFRFGYRDQATGEFGLLSDEIEITTANSTYVHMGIRFLINFPGYLMSESLALAIDVYRTELNGSKFYFDRTILHTQHNGAPPAPPAGTASAKYGVLPNSANASYDHVVLYQALYVSDEDLRAHKQLLPTIELPPMGCKAVRSIRGWPMFGGSLGDAGSRFELMQGRMSLFFDPAATSAHPDEDEVYARGYNYGFETLDAGFGGPLRGIPGSYAGQFLFAQTLFPNWSRQIARLDHIKNTKINWDSGGGPWPGGYGDPTEQRWRIEDTPIVDGQVVTGGARTDRISYVKLSRGKLQIGEQDFPWVVPSINTNVVSDDIDEDIEGIGEVGGQAAICTRGHTYVLGFSESPVGVPSEMAADRFGCIAANSMVSFDGGCAWISDRGPAAVIGGRFEWIGEHLEHLFSAETSVYKRDRQGMMRHAWGCHDAERGLIYFGLFADRNNSVLVTHKGITADFSTSTDEARSRFPCDEVLIYSYRTGSWSVWRPMRGMEILWMARGQDSDGNSRVFFLAADKRIYALDDTYAIFNKETIKSTVAVASSGTTIQMTTSVGSTVSDRGGGTYVQNGMLVTITSGDKDVIAVEEIVSFTSNTLTFANSVTVQAGYLVHIGVKRARMVTTYRNPKGPDMSRIASVGARYAVWGRLQAVGSGQPQLAHGQAVVVTGRKVDTVDNQLSKVEVTMTTNEGTPDFTYMGGLTGSDEAQDIAFKRGSNHGQNHQLDLTVVGGAQIRIQDLYAEVQ